MVPRTTKSASSARLLRLIWTPFASILRRLGVDVGVSFGPRWQPPVDDPRYQLWQEIAARRARRAELVSGWIESASAGRAPGDLEIPARSEAGPRSARRQGRRWAVALVAVATLLAASVGALAFFTATGSGSGSGTAATPQAVTISPGTTPPQQGLYPAGSADVVATITNPNSFVVHLSSVILDTGQPTNGFAVDAAHSSCNLSSLSFNGPQTNGGADFVIPAGGHLDVDLSNAISMSAAAVNACQGATFTVYLKAGP